jgi:hypothetical protein
MKECSDFIKMTSSNALKCVVSDYETTDEVAPRKPFNINPSVYIQEQEGKDVFEYSVFGSPQQKIGNFTQTKIGGFS